MTQIAESVRAGATVNARYSAEISPNGVRYIWLRENMNTIALRLAKVESLSNTAKDFA